MNWLIWIVIATAGLRGYVQDTTSADPRSEQARTAITPELGGVVDRATEYVAKYEAELGNLIGTEEYLQIASWLKPTENMEISHTSSDFVLIEVGGHWNALRMVKVADGRKVEDVQPSLESVFDDSPANNAKRFLSIKADNTKYNIGDIFRETNVPTLALQVVRKDQVSRFAFERAGSEKIDGFSVWRVKFREMSGTTLVANHNGGENLYSSGVLWIEPDTGTVVKTEFRVNDSFAKPSVSSNIVVTYAKEKRLQIMVPKKMAEHYETENTIINCQADYSNFHRFQVETHFDFGFPLSPRPAP